MVSTDFYYIINAVLWLVMIGLLVLVVIKCVGDLAGEIFLRSGIFLVVGK